MKDRETYLKDAGLALDEAVLFIEMNPHTGGTSALARIILHAHNTIENPLDITDIGRLDTEREALAWQILQARIMGKEPLEITENKEPLIVIINEYRIKE
jgi:hypothetical protein